MQSRVPLGPGKFHVVVLVIGNVLFLIPELLLEQRKLFSLWMTIQVCHPECINLIGSNYLTRILHSFRLT